MRRERAPPDTPAWASEDAWTCLAAACRVPSCPVTGIRPGARRKRDAGTCAEGHGSWYRYRGPWVPPLPAGLLLLGRGRGARFKPGMAKPAYRCRPVRLRQLRRAAQELPPVSSWAELDYGPTSWTVRAAHLFRNLHSKKKTSVSKSSSFFPQPRI